jgi:hypothetical protein
MSHPNLFLIGTAKGGSSTLAFHLASHPEIGMATKEPNIFNCDTVADCKARLDEFAQGGLDQRWRLDGSVNYSQYPKFTGVPGHIAALTDPKQARFIYIMRNPVDRAISQYFWRRERFGEERSFDAATDADSVYVMSGRYDLQIRQYMDHFSLDQFYFVKHDDYFADTAVAYADICRWLDISDAHHPDVTQQRGSTKKSITRGARFPFINRIVRASPKLRRQITQRLPIQAQRKLSGLLTKPVAREEITQEQRRRLQDAFIPSIKATEDLTGLDLSNWQQVDSRT